MASAFCLASAGDDIKLWNCDGYVLEKQLNPHNSNICSICWSHDNSVLTSASTSGDKIVMTYPEQSAFTYSVAENQQVSCVVFNSTSRYVMGGSKTGVVHIWDLKSKTLKKTYQDHKGAISALQFNWNDTMVASGSESGEILLYNVVSGVASSPLVGTKTQAVRRVQYSHFKKSLLGSCSDSGGVYLWDANKRQLLNSFTTSHLAPATSIAFSPLNEMLLMSVGLDKRIVCYDVQGKEAVQTMLADSPLTSVDLMHDGVTLAVGTTRGRVHVYDLRKGAEPLRSLTAHKSSVQGLAFQHKPTKTDHSVGKSATISNRHKSHSIPSSNSNHIKSSGANKVNGSLHPHREQLYTDDNSNTLLQTSPANLQSHGISHLQNGEEVFSPIRERLSFNRSNNNSLLKLATTPKQSDASGDIRGSYGGKNTSTNSYADGMFSPMGSGAETSGKSSLGLTSTLSFGLGSRRQPIGGASEGQALESRVEVDEFYHDPVRLDAASPTPEPRVPADSHYNAAQHRPLDGVDAAEWGSSQSLSPPSQSHLTNSVSRRSPHRHPDSSPHQHTSPPQHKPSLAVTSPARVTPAHVASLVTPTDAGPSQPAGEAAGFHTQVLRGLVDEALEEFRDQVRQDVLNLHVEMLKQFQIQQEEMRSMLEQYSINGHLLEEVERLREENKRLKKTF